MALQTLKRMVAVLQAIFRPYSTAMKRIEVGETIKNQLIYSGYTVMVADEQKAVDDVMHIFWATIDNAHGAKTMNRLLDTGIGAKPLNYYLPSVKLIWVTPKAEEIIAYCARCSSPENQDNPEYEKLLKYCIRNNHVSVFEMASMCVEIKCSRSISRQLIRHKLRVQEFSQRYSQVKSPPTYVETRTQDTKNRQNSNVCTDTALDAMFQKAQRDVWENTNKAYEDALKAGVAKESARALLPEGLTESTFYLASDVRTWMHFLDVRFDGPGVQKECREVAEQVLEIFKKEFPTISAAKNW